MQSDSSSDKNEINFPYYQGEAKFSPIPLTVSSPQIVATDKGKIRANAVESMIQHAQQQMEMLKKQAQLIMDQVAEIETRVKLSEEIYAADMSFEPVVGQVYHLYERENGKKFLSIVGPKEWGRTKADLIHLATVRLLADKSWSFDNNSRENK